MSEKQYLDLLDRVLIFGEERADRTGVGTISRFGERMVFDLERDFPAVTTKQLFFRGVKAELLWFLRGHTNYQDLDPAIQQWWTPWARKDGDLGPIYGEQYRRARWWFQTDPLIFDPPEVQSYPELFCGVGDLGPYKREPHASPSHEEQLLKNVWRDMLKRCYDKNSRGYMGYGAKGVHVCDRWLYFPNFLEDAKQLPGWHLKLTYPGQYSLDKDILYASNRYGPDTCTWASRTEQGYNTSTGTPFEVYSPENVPHLFASIGEMVRATGANPSAIHRCLQGKLHTHQGWHSFRYINGDQGRVIRFREVDQLHLLIAGLIHNPYSRRHMINLWHTPAMEHAALPCCHGSVIQFYVRDSELLDCQVYQRSGDMFIGVPINIASYALLTHLVARSVGLRAGRLIHVLGDAHIYKNHVEQVREQVSRTPYEPPSLWLNPEVQDIDSFTMDDIELVGYESHPPIQGDVAV